uniref:MARVEL domain-containing protein n=1 Tax=Steinernema glaseri TaxID=37863 RepID=A0A1I7Z9A5_9BILA
MAICLQADDRDVCCLCKPLGYEEARKLGSRNEQCSHEYVLLPKHLITRSTRSFFTKRSKIITAFPHLLDVVIKIGKVVARFLAILFAVLLFAHFINTLRSFGGYNSFHNWTLLLAGSIVYGTFLYGSFYEEKYFLIPFIFSQLLMLLVLIISLSLTASTLLMSFIYANQGYKFTDEERSDYVVAMSFMGILALIEIWMATVGCKAFQYIRDRDASLEEPTAMPVGDFVIDKAVI